jgi:hypothetical protein
LAFFLAKQWILKNLKKSSIKSIIFWILIPHGEIYLFKIQVREIIFSKRTIILTKKNLNFKKLILVLVIELLDSKIALVLTAFLRLIPELVHPNDLILLIHFYLQMN